MDAKAGIPPAYQGRLRNLGCAPRCALLEAVVVTVNVAVHALVDVTAQGVVDPKLKVGWYVVL
jgi:hypothetical protein